MCSCVKYEKRQEITFSTWGSHSEIKVINQLIKTFEKQNNVKVNLIHIPQNYFQKLHLLFASNQAPDVIFLNNYYLKIYNDANKLLDLSPFFQEEIDRDVFFKNSTKSLSVDGDLYAVPRDISNVVVFYNKDLFDKYKIKYPDENWTYNDLFKIGKLFKQNNMYAIGIEDAPVFWEPILWANNGAIFNEKGELEINTVNSLSALAWFVELRTKHGFSPSVEELSNKTMAQLFLNQEIAMHVSGRWLVPRYRQEAKFDWDIVNLPHGIAGSVSGSDTSGWAISRQTQNLELSIKFVKYLSSYDVISEITKTGLITPARRDVAYSSVFLDKKLLPKNSIIFIKNNDNAKINIIPKNYNRKIEQLMKLLEPYFLGIKKITQYTKFEL